MSKKAEESYFERLNQGVMEAYDRVGAYSPEQLSQLKQFAQVLMGKPLVDHVPSR